MAAEEQQFEQFAGHPKGLYYLAFTEMWERFSFYGMSALLSLYMVKELLPQHSAQVFGLVPLRHGLEFNGAMSDLAFASIIYGWYAGLVYFTPLIGGWVADRLLGAKRTVLIGVVLMSAGHAAMSFYSTFVLALVLLIMGSGFLKGNISAQVGALYPREDESRRSRGYTIFSTGICIGAAFGPVVSGLVAAIWGWHAGFAVSAVLMLVAMAGYILGQKHLADVKPVAAQREKAPPLTPAERRRVAVLLLVIALTFPAEITYPMVWSIGILWVDQWVNLATPLGTVPSSWFAGMDSLGSVLFAPVLVALWGWQARRGSEPSNVTKQGLGTAIVSAAALLFAFSNLGVTTEHSIGAVWAIAGWLIMGLGWMYYWPTTMAIVSKAAPPRVASTLMGVAFLSPFAAHVTAGWVGSYFDAMTPTMFWTMDAAIGAVGATVILLLRKVLSAELDGKPEVKA
ncbi:MAG: peptide MFS transporter [Novosphingobium sp.]|uniref:peptide MFS transporter n=1 Tax=Novosphingobium sp. TaxID=1874826 RepID=UPI00301AEAAA